MPKHQAPRSWAKTKVTELSNYYNAATCEIRLGSAPLLGGLTKRLGSLRESTLLLGSAEQRHQSVPAGCAPAHRWTEATPPAGGGTRARPPHHRDATPCHDDHEGNCAPPYVDDDDAVIML